MRLALDEARLAASGEDVPVGAVVLGRRGEVVARAHNAREAEADPTAHAEILALRAAGSASGDWRLDGHTLVVTLEPCPMCAGAVTAARVSRLVFGADDPRAGAVGSLFDVVRDPRMPNQPEVIRGVLADECGALLRAFFTARRTEQEPS
jgi:tRNA(adenine34) deaminase